MTVIVRQSGCTYSDLFPGVSFKSNRVLHRGEMLSISRYFRDMAELAPPVPMKLGDLWPPEHFQKLVGDTLGLSMTAPAVTPDHLDDSRTRMKKE